MRTNNSNFIQGIETETEIISSDKNDRSVSLLKSSAIKADDETKIKSLAQENEMQPAANIIKSERANEGKSKSSSSECYPSIASLPQQNNWQERHMIEPPLGPIVLVCCETTKGPLNIAVHPTWAPLGAERFLNMVATGYFSSKIALFRCLRKFLCQFGLAGDPALNKPYSSMKDDPPWLPLGPKHRFNAAGVKRFPKGYLAYAGGGQNSRSNQLIVALADNGRLAGGSPWEVPWGEVVGDISMRTLDQFYTGYGEKGPSQHILHKEGSSERVADDYPLLDYILECHIVEDGRGE